MFAPGGPGSALTTPLKRLQNAALKVRISTALKRQLAGIEHPATTEVRISTALEPFRRTFAIVSQVAYCGFTTTFNNLPGT